MQGQRRALEEALVQVTEERDSHRKELAQLAILEQNRRCAREEEWQAIHSVQRREIEMLRHELSLVPQTAAAVRDNAMGKAQSLLDDVESAEKRLSLERLESSRLREEVARLQEALMNQRNQSKAIFLGNALPDSFVEWSADKRERGYQNSPEAVLNLGGVLHLPDTVEEPAHFKPASPEITWEREKQIWVTMARGAHKQSSQQRGEAPQPWLGKGDAPGFVPASPMLSYSEEKAIWNTILSNSRASSPVSKRRISIQDDLSPIALDNHLEEDLVTAVQQGFAQLQ